MTAIADRPFCSAPQCCEPAPVIDSKGRPWCTRHMPETPEQRDDRHRGYLQLSLGEWRRRARDAEALVEQLRATAEASDRVSEQHRKRVQELAAERDLLRATCEDLDEKLGVERTENAAFRAFISTRGLSGDFESSEQRLRMLERRL